MVLGWGKQEIYKNTLKGRDHVGDLGTDGGMILISVSDEQVVIGFR
jgi:hypothetical protein